MSSPSVKKNYIYNILYQILTIITPLITAPYVSRVLGADGIGIYSYTSSIMAYFVMFSVLGTLQYGIREIARLRDDRLEMSKAFWEIVIIRGFCTAICLLAWLCFSFSSEEYQIFYLALIPTLLTTIFDIAWFYTGIEKMGYTVLLNSICKVIGILALFGFVHEKDDLLIYIFLNSSILFLGALSMWIYVPKEVERVTVRILTFKRHIKGTFSYFLITIAISLYTVLDKVMIGLITNDNYQNGYYEQANKIITLASSFTFVALNGVMGARMSYLFAHKKYDEIKERISRSFDFCFLVGFGLLFGICSVSKCFVPVFFGEGYEPVIDMLYLKSPLLIIISISTILGSQYYLPSGNINKSTLMTISGSILNLAANALFIPQFGAMGAIMGTLIGESFISVIYFYNARKYLAIKRIIAFSYKRIIAGCIMLGISYLLQRYFNTADVVVLTLHLVLAFVVYVSCLFVLRDRMFFELLDIVKSKLIKR